ncbi:MAG: glycosyltransferase family 2 protein [Actinomycetota bacterium]
MSDPEASLTDPAASVKSPAAAEAQPTASRRDPAARPLLSVVMVTYGGTQWIRPAVDALAANTEAPYELIVVDNASPPDTIELLRCLEGATVIFNDRNVGFGPGANQGVLHATGTYVCILNSDAFVEPGWLPPLIEALEHDPSAGAAVPRLLHIDGRLQEAGGVVGCDGSTRALGDGDDPEALPYRFRRYADYGSAACLIMHRRIFSEVGGFDPAYPLGYCEDVDLCFALSERGLKTVYEPRSRVRHVRWGSSSRVESERRVFANQPILLARWRERLAARPSFATPPFPDHDILQARDAESLDRVLIVTDDAWGWPAPGSGRLRRLATEINRLWPASRVTLLAAPSHAGTPAVAELLAGGVEVAAAQDWDAWFESRRFHYSAVLLSGPASYERFDPLIAATQPQASRLYDLERPAHRWAEELLHWWPALGAGPTSTLPGRLRSLEAWGLESADVVLCASRRSLLFAQGCAPGTPAVRVETLAEVTDGAGWDQREGVRAAGVLPSGPRFGSLQPGAGADLLAPLRAIREALTPLAGELADHLVVDPQLGSLGRWPDLGVHASPRVVLVPPPLVLSLGDLPTTPFVTWKGGAVGLDLGGLGSLLVGDSPDELARLLRDLHEDQSLWEHVASTLAGSAAEACSREEGSLWGALAHCGFGAPVAQQLRRTLARQ